MVTTLEWQDFSMATPKAKKKRSFEEEVQHERWSQSIEPLVYLWLGLNLLLYDSQRLPFTLSSVPQLTPAGMERSPWVQWSRVQFSKGIPSSRWVLNLLYIKKKHTFLSTPSDIKHISRQRYRFLSIWPMNDKTGYPVVSFSWRVAGFLSPFFL